MQVAIRALGFEVKKADVLKILRDYDRDGSGKITYQDFSEISERHGPRTGRGRDKEGGRGRGEGGREVEGGTKY